MERTRAIERVGISQTAIDHGVQELEWAVEIQLHAIVIGYHAPFSVFVESKWETTEISGGTRNNVFITPGLLWDLPRLGQRLGRWRIGFGVRFGLADADDSYTFLTRIKLDFGLKWGSKKTAKE